MPADKAARIGHSIHLVHDGAQIYCPHCGHGPLDGVTGVKLGTKAEVFRETGGEYQPGNPPPPMLPTPGSPSICVGCGGLLVFNDALQQVAPSDGDIAEWMADPSLWATLTSLSEAYKKRRK